MRGLVYKSTGSWYIVRDEQGKNWNARIKGVMKLDAITSTNPVAVGDWVNLEVEEELAGTAMIVEIEPRRNYLHRQSPRHKHQHHIVAANLDLSMLIVTVKNPKTSTGFIDRCLIASEMYHVPSLIVCNKADQHSPKENATFEEWKRVYSGVGYPVLLVSAETGIGMEDLLQRLNGKTTLVTGHSGVGKSSLLNRWLPGLNRRTQDVSGWSGKGLHTTTFAEMFDLPGGGRIIDTPGMREFGLVNLERAELSHYFPEMRRVLEHCQFNNCLHLNEPDCAVKEAVREGVIDERRYLSYVNLLESIDERNY
ncbi:MAG: ribosome small subunit-dependent GTPase A [Bacteroidetes bacterium]|nr:ribosome small subunit-dependent GTPase A [Bacteroidota bacterium]